jgi:hypothetical protein
VLSTEGLTLFGPGSEWFWSMLQSVVVAITLVGIYVQLRQARAASAFNQAGALQEQWEAERMVRRRLAIAVALRDGGPDADLEALCKPIANFWEGVGALVRAKHIELAVVQEDLGPTCLTWWSVLEPEVRRTQAEVGTDIWVHFEWLAGEVARYRRAQGLPDLTRQHYVAMVVRWISGWRAEVAEMEAMRTMTLAQGQALPPQTVTVATATATASGSPGIEEPSPGTAAGRE